MEEPQETIKIWLMNKGSLPNSTKMSEDAKKLIEKGWYIIMDSMDIASDEFRTLLIKDNIRIPISAGITNGILSLMWAKIPKDIHAEIFG